MIRRNFDYLLIATLLTGDLYVTASGLVMDIFDQYQFAFPAGVGCICAALDVVHLVPTGGRSRFSSGSRWKARGVESLTHRQTGRLA